MRSHRRACRSALLAAALLVSLTGVVHAGEEAGGDITFRITLRGDVVEGDGFTLSVNDVSSADPGIIDPGELCGPDVLEPHAPRPCEPGSYEFVLEDRDVRPIGTRLEYTWARIHGVGEDRRDTIIYTATATVTQSAQVLTVVYGYGGGAQLPNTAVDLPFEPGPLWVTAIFIAGIGTLLDARSARNVLIDSSTLMWDARRDGHQRSDGRLRVLGPAHRGAAPRAG